jgi:hypothetical protein
MTKRSFLTLIAMLVLTLALTACGGGDNSEPDPGEGEAEGEAEAEAEEGEGENFATFNATFTYEGEVHEFNYTNDPDECGPCPDDRDPQNGLCFDTAHCSGTCEQVGQYWCVLEALQYGIISARNPSNSRVGVRIEVGLGRPTDVAYVKVQLVEAPACSEFENPDGCFRFGSMVQLGDPKRDQHDAITYAEESEGTRAMFHVEQICAYRDRSCVGPETGVLDGEAFLPSD